MISVTGDHVTLELHVYLESTDKARNKSSDTGMMPVIPIPIQWLQRREYMSCSNIPKTRIIVTSYNNSSTE